MSDPTQLHLPQSFPYPITITDLAVNPSNNVERGSRLLSYSFIHVVPDPNTPPEVRYGTWDSTIEGTLDKWNFRSGDVVSARKARDVPAVLITEPCKHGVQLGGLCCLCGKDMTSYDYTGFSDASRASIQMTHLANGPTVSLEEAQRIERETAQHLIKSRKLSLIVDLDQTIVHATVDPTVGEWIAEGEAWEVRQAKRTSKASEDSSDTPKERNGDKEEETASDDTASEDEEDEVNPNWEALKDVKKFRLGPEALGQTDNRSRKAKDKSVEQDGCMYYIKPRPGWQDFLRQMANKYEMHVYTMGTRAYAEEVCAAIDPESKIFGGRILSRDESGSLTQKSLQRLFPCDQSMVVIIDDRADVWEWSPNLVKVIPYDFFVGIGDINSAFLPKLEPLTPVLEVPSSPSPPPPPSASSSSSPTSSPTPTTLSQSSSEGDVDTNMTTPPTSPIGTSTPDGLLEDEVDDEAVSAFRKKELLHRNHEALDAQVEERPLAKKQEALQEAEATTAPSTPGTNGSETGTGSGEDAANPIPVNGEPIAVPVASASASGSQIPNATGGQKKEKVVRKALLKNDDMELNRVQALLEEVHKRFYQAYDEREQERKTHQKHTRRKEHGHVPYDVRTIIPELRMNTLRDVHILFSSVIPLDTRPESTEIWRTAEAFGATCYTELNKRITHVVAAKRGTVKVDSARRQGGIKIVWLSWFTDSIALWHKQDETNYLMDPPPPPPPPTDDNDNDSVAVGTPTSPHQISSDPEPDADDWDDDGRAGPDKEGLEGAGAGTGLSGGVSMGIVRSEGEKGEGGDGKEGKEGLALDEMIWDDMNDEVEAAMNESDDDESVRTGGRSENVSEDDWTDESNSVISSTTSSPRRNRKRLRSVTPSDAGLSDPDVLRSPLAKRKKIAADRSGASKLKEAFSAADVALDHSDDSDMSTSSGTGLGVGVGGAGTGSSASGVGLGPLGEEETKSEGTTTEGSSKATTPRNGVGGDGDGDEMDQDDDGDDGDTDGETEGGEIDDDDDFLARELGEDWG